MEKKIKITIIGNVVEVIATPEEEVLYKKAATYITKKYENYYKLWGKEKCIMEIMAMTMLDMAIIPFPETNARSNNKIRKLIETLLTRGANKTNS